MDVTKICGECRNNMKNLPERVQDALTELEPDQHLSVQIGLCAGCPLVA